MKQKTTLVYTMTFVIVGLLITSAAGVSTKNVDKPAADDTKTKEIAPLTGAELPQGAYVLSTDYRIKTGEFPTVLQKSSIQKHTMSLPSVAIEPNKLPSPRAQEEYFLLAQRPAFADDGRGNFILGHYYYFENDTASEGPIVLWQGSDNYGDSWDSGGFYWAGEYDFPSMHYRGENATGLLYSGTVRDDPASGTLGGATNIILCEGNVTDPDNYAFMYWNWSTYGWYGAVCAENAEAYYAPADWAWGFNSHVMSTTYPDPDIVNGPFINYQTDAEGYGTISWYSGLNGCLSTDAALDENSNWYINETYGTITSAGYAVWDPENDTVPGKHFPCIRAFDWIETSPLDNEDAYDILYYWTYEDPLISAERPAIDAGNGNIICLWELHNVNETDPNEVGVAIWATNDGDIGNLNTTAYIGIDNGRVENPEICHIQGDTFMGHVTVDNQLLMFITYDGGQTWDGLYYWNATGQTVIDEYRNCDISDEGSFSIWEYAFDDGPGAGSGIKLMYGLNTVELNGYCFQAPYGNPAVPPVTVTVDNLDVENDSLIPDVTNNYYMRKLVLGLDIWTNTTFNIAAIDGEGFSGDVTHVFEDIYLFNTINLTLSPPISIVGARSIRSHAGTEYALDLFVNNIESRVNGVQIVEFDLSDTADASAISASVECVVAGPYEGTIIISQVDTDTIRLTFDPALPDQDACTITLTGEVEDSFCVRTLECDVDFDGQVLTVDASKIKSRFQDPIDGTNFWYDVDCDNQIITVDASKVKSRFQHTCPPCP